MGICCSSHPKTHQATSSPDIGPSRQDAIVLLLGPVGARTTPFAEAATGGASSNSSQDTLRGPSRTQIRVFETSVSDRRKRVIFLVPSLFDNNNITESSTINEVKRWLNLHRHEYPHVDHILCFSEVGKRFHIQLAPVGSYLSELKDLCGINDIETLCSKVSLVTAATVASGDAGSGVPKEWAFLREHGSRVFIFEGGAESALDLIGQIFGG